MEDSLLPSLTRCHFECRKGPEDKSQTTTLSHNCHVLEHEFAYVGFQVLVVFPDSIPNSTHFGHGTNCLDFSGDLVSTGSQAPLKSAD